MGMNLWFSSVSQFAMMGWLILALAPRRPKWLLQLTGLAMPTLMGIAYGVFILPNMADVEGAGYVSLDAVRALFSDDRLLLAGWIHYLAFDLAVGTYVAWRSDILGLSRIIQLPLLFLTFMFGPIGLMAFVIMVGLQRGSSRLTAPHLKDGDIA